MTLGQKIKKSRIDKGLTQKDLSDKIHVTFQTISKWENDENEPDVSTLRELAKLFDCSLDYLLSEDEEEKQKEEKEVTPVVTQVEHKTVIVHEYAPHVCAKCGKDIKSENELVSEDNVRHERHGRMTRTVNTGQTYYHKACFEQVKKERLEAAARVKAQNTAKARKLTFIWSIVGGVVALGIALAIFLGAPAMQKALHPAAAVGISIGISYAIFAAIYCILSGSYIGDVFTWAAGLSIRFPGLIFSWDIEGVMWLIGMKILFAILGFLIGVFALLFAIALSGSLGAISFPFVLIHNTRSGYDDSLFMPYTPTGGYSGHHHRGGRRR